MRISLRYARSTSADRRKPTSGSPRHALKRCPHIRALDAQLITTRHAVLGNANLGSSLPYESLALFLQRAHKRVRVEWDAHKVQQVVEDIIDDIAQDQDVRITLTIRTAPNLPEGSNEDVTALFSLLAGVRKALCGIEQFMQGRAGQLREQHGGVQKHDSMEDLTAKVGNCVDRSALKVLVEQVFAMHAEQLATTNGEGAMLIRKIVKLIDMALVQQK
ncbi:hypothetical protein BU24DRAFT_472148 [Aaosphaeria arxii CBS 175.79]|uniref:Uncharacterized protein n=1 Tax=Aaosphaeria arxii CBS 175.79 TaxID=1450172 RepID=A0A6A5XDP6_9PLEO|nr:uncharacterized protein BU24DRAFT_472148 [Aaosphaeria arxii CBS 175.79]KAF2011019.1 hypothetical protein BU24DRAFT_472148 [Aaosphaeria arxii CBS 175.79]